MKTIAKYEAFDGKVFDDAEACKAYEGENVVGRLVGLTAEQVTAALDRTDVDLADAIEAVAGKITKKRYEQGEKRRTRRTASAAAEPAPQPSEPAPDASTAAPSAAGGDGEPELGADL